MPGTQTVVFELSRPITTGVSRIPSRGVGEHVAEIRDLRGVPVADGLVELAGAMDGTCSAYP